MANVTPMALLRVFLLPGLYVLYQVFVNHQTITMDLIRPLYPFFAIQALFLFSRGGSSGGEIVGKKAPSLQSLQFIQGSQFDIGEGHVTVVEFWATWCPPCRTSIPHINALYLRLKEEGVRFVGITREDKPTVQKFIQGMKDSFTYPVAIDTTGTVSSAYPHSGIPHAVIVGGDGTVAWAGHPMNLETEVRKAMVLASKED